MCLAIPMKITALNESSEWSGRAEVWGVSREVDLSLVQPVECGEFVLVHAGFAIEKIDAVEAEKTLELIRAMQIDSELDAVGDRNDKRPRFLPGSSTSGTAGPAESP